MRKSQQDVTSSEDRKPGNGCSGCLVLLAIVSVIGALLLTNGNRQDSVPREQLVLPTEDLPSDWKEQVERALVGYESLVKSDRLH